MTTQDEKRSEMAERRATERGAGAARGGAGRRGKEYWWGEKRRRAVVGEGRWWVEVEQQAKQESPAGVSGAPCGPRGRRPF